MGYGRGDLEGPMKGEKHKYLFSKVKASELPVGQQALSFVAATGAATGAATSAATSADTVSADVDMLQNAADLFGSD